MSPQPERDPADEPERILRETFGHSEFRGPQREIIERALQGEHSLVLMPTGMGKSLCYQIPPLVCQGLCLVVSPLIALMKDQVDGLQAKGVAATFINSSIRAREREARLKAVLEGRIRLLYVTPERFRKPEFIAGIRRAEPMLLAIDEAHCLSEWGHDFRPDYSRIGKFRELLGNPPTLALTATATPRVQEDILHHSRLDPAQVKVFHEGVERPNLFLGVRQVHGDSEKLAAIQELLEAGRGSAIVYFALVKTLERFSGLLEKAGVEHLRYHGRLSASARRGLQDAFMKGECPLVLATNAFGMGVDKEDIGTILHAELPGSMEAYAQETGRAGRDGLPARCELLYDEQDLLIQMEFLDWANPGADYLGRLVEVIDEKPEELNSQGLDWLRAQMTWKSNTDFRLETALNLLDRYGVTQGELARRDLRTTKNLGGKDADALFDDSLRKQKKTHDQQRLYQLVQYIKQEECRRSFLHAYFGFEDPPCGNCDTCMS